MLAETGRDMERMAENAASAIVIPTGNLKDFAETCVTGKIKPESYVEFKINDGILVTAPHPAVLKKLLKLAHDKGLVVAPRVSVALVRPEETLVDYAMKPDGPNEGRASVVFDDNARRQTFAIEIDHGYRTGFAVLTINTAMNWKKYGEPYPVLEGFTIEQYKLSESASNSTKFEFELVETKTVTYDDLPADCAILFRVAELLRFPMGIEANVADRHFTGDNVGKEVKRLRGVVGKLSSYLESLTDVAMRLTKKTDKENWEAAEKRREEDCVTREEERRRRDEERRRPVVHTLESQMQAIRDQMEAEKKSAGQAKSA